MLFAIVMHDRPDGQATRAAVQDAHRAWVGENAAVMYAGGPLLAEDGETIVGSLIIGDFADGAAAADFIAAEPYNRAGLFESVVIRQFGARIERGQPASPFVAGEADR